MEASSTCPKCGSMDVRRLGKRGLVICVALIMLLILIGNVLIRMGEKEMAMNPDKYQNELSARYEASTDKYDFPVTTQVGAGLKAISNVLILYAIFLLVKFLGGKKKCAVCKAKFKIGLSSEGNNESSIRPLVDGETSQISSLQRGEVDKPDHCPKKSADAKHTKRVHGEVHCKGCGKLLIQAQVNYMLGNPKYNDWSREGFCRLACFEKHKGEIPSR